MTVDVRPGDVVDVKRQTGLHDDGRRLIVYLGPGTWDFIEDVLHQPHLSPQERAAMEAVIDARRQEPPCPQCNDKGWYEGIEHTADGEQIGPSQEQCLCSGSAVAGLDALREGRQ